MENIEIQATQTSYNSDDYDISHKDKIIAKIYRDFKSSKYCLIFEYKNKKYRLESFVKNIFSKITTQLIDLQGNRIILKSRPYSTLFSSSLTFSDSESDYCLKFNFFSSNVVLIKNGKIVCTYYRKYKWFRGNVSKVFINKEYEQIWEDKLFLEILFGLFFHTFNAMIFESPSP